jgi:hypothetical protein
MQAYREPQTRPAESPHIVGYVVTSQDGDTALFREHILATIYVQRRHDGVIDDLVKLGEVQAMCSHCRRRLCGGS